MEQSGLPVAAHISSRLASLSLRQMRFLVALADEGGFSRAAARVRVSQPAISAGVRQVEALLGVRLFDRTTHNVAPTDIGAALLPHVRRLLVTADHVFADMAEAVHRRDVVRIGAIPSIMPMLARQIASFGHPAEADLDIHVSDGTSDALLEQVIRGALDIVVCAGAIEDPSLDVSPLVDDELLLVVPLDHRFTRAGVCSWADLHDRDVIHFAGGSIGDITSAAMRQNNLLPSCRYRIDQVGSLFGLVSAGLAIGIMPRLYTIGYASPDTMLITLRQPRVTRKIVAVSRQSLPKEHPVAAAITRQLVARMVAALNC